MKKFNNLMIIGDSFCRIRNKESDWPVALGKMLNCTVHGRGHGGGAWWASKRDLASYKEDPATTILIVVHTEFCRLPNDYEIPVNIGQAFVDKNYQLTELDKWPGIRKIAASFYTSDLFCPDFYHWAQQAWIKELDEDTEYYTTIHIPAFDSVDLTCVKNGIFVIPSQQLRSLRTLSSNEIGEEYTHGRDPRSNHFLDTNNVNLARALASVILKLQPGDTGERNFNNLHDWEFYQKTVSNKYTKTRSKR